MATRFMLESNDPDIGGCWNKVDVEAEMKELGLDLDDNWISYVLSHYGFPASIVNALEDENVLTMAFKFNDDVVYAAKK